MITIKTEKEIEILKEGGKILSEVLKEVSKLAEPGVSTGFLNKKAKEMILSRGAAPAFEGYTPGFSEKPYPAAICASLNEVVVHGIPSEDIILQDGDVLKIDIGVKYKNLFTDAAVTVGIGDIGLQKKNLMETVKKALDSAIGEIGPEKKLGDIGRVIETVIESGGFSVVEDLVGHGVGYGVHEEPNIPNYGKRGTGPILKPGMVLAIEPMAALGKGRIRQSKDGFGYETYDRSVSAHFEHTVVVTDDGNEVVAR